MSHRCNLSTSAERESVSARKPPIQPTPITAASTVFTARSLLYLLRADKNHDGIEGATLPFSVTLRCEPLTRSRASSRRACSQVHAGCACSGRAPQDDGTAAGTPNTFLANSG